MAKRVFALLAAAVLLLVLISVPASAIHEDEQGLRDFVLRFVGNAQYAAVPPVESPQHVFVATEEGAVGGIRTDAFGGLNVSWRTTLSSQPLCLAASATAVVVVDRNGAVEILDGVSGQIVTSFVLSTTAALSTAACALNEEEAVIVSSTGTEVGVFRIDLEKSEESVKPTTGFTLGAPATSLILAGETVWVNSDGAAALSYKLDGSKTDESAVPGTVVDAMANGALSVLNADLTVALRSNAAAGLAVPKCARCTAAFIRGEEGEPTSEEVVTVSTSAANIEVVFPSGAKVAIPQTPESAFQAYPLLSFQSASAGVTVLVKTGSRHLLLVTEKGLVWERKEGLANAAAVLISDPVGPLDHFKLNKQALIVSRFAVLYALPLEKMGREIHTIVDFSAQLLAKLNVKTMKSVDIRSMRTTSTTTVEIRARSGSATAVVTVDIAKRSVLRIDTTDDSLITTYTFHVTKDLKVVGDLGTDEVTVYTVNTTAGEVEGYSVTVKGATPTWKVRMPYPIIVHASGHEEPGRTAVVNDLRVYPSRHGTEKVDEVRHKYPTDNVLVLAYYEPADSELTTLVVVALDTVTGSVLGTTRHRNVEGDVHMVVVEHTIVYHFLDAANMRYNFGVWELFEESDGAVMRKDAGATLPLVIASFFVKTDRGFSSRAARPPVVVASTLGVVGGPLSALSVTVSQQAIARKTLVLAFETGRVAIVEHRALLAGNQIPLDQADTSIQVSHVIIPSLLFSTHRYRLAAPEMIAVSPTGLESSTHVIVSGLDVFYVRASTGKPFDLLNSDFNKPLLIALVATFAGLSLITRYFVTRKGLNAQWK